MLREVDLRLPRLAEWRTHIQALWRDGAGLVAGDVRILKQAGRAALARLPLGALRQALREAALECRDLWRDAAGAGAQHLAQDSRVLTEAARAWLARTPAAPAWRRLQTAAAPLLAQVAQQALPLRRALADHWAHGHALAVQTARRASAEISRALTALAPAWREAAKLPARRPALVLPALLLADAALAAVLIGLLVPDARPLPAPATPQPVLRAAVIAPGLAKEPPRAAASPTASPSPSPEPTATFEPVLTATPIPILFTTWESSLPQYGGWNGAGECWGPVLAPAGSGAFVWPTDRRYLVGKNYNARYHPGLDLGGEIGDPLYAADSGVVVYAGWSVYGYGNLVIIDHGNGWHTLYAHLSQINVTCGQGLTQGSLLGLAGSTGRSTGPHLHFEMRYLGVNVNPWSYLP